MDKDGLDELMESEKKKEEQKFNEADDDDIQSCIDIREFERRLKSARSSRIKNKNDSSSDDDFGNNDFGRSFMSIKSGSHIRNSSKNSLNSTAQMNLSKNSIQSKVQQIKQSQQMIKPSASNIQASQAAKKNLKKYDDPELEQIMKASNIEQKVKELLNKYQQLQKNFDRERNLRQKYEGEHLSQNKTRLEETSTNITTYQSSKLGKGSILNAINQNEENVTLKQEVQKLQKEVQKKEKMLQELIMDKATGSSTSSSNGFKVFEDSKIKRLENELKILKKERDEFFASRFDKIYFQKNAELVKDLSYQNSKMRVKIEELEQMLKKN
ncbi:hypothetical protein TTHERM_00238950 (macronuclear) [Tetrahymena thermophila SB210]|uniref:Uncharacterized protein n=1 Tax=Tetrahymena thermophila (strain SB210) TaxID=312017 RepID=I7MIM3_TETTS|nr:hypothetical protein TTHERM_00238950 [Tetrahymena thermophila SB210]EAS04575.2 hypothetical protein TTHERM_00238950 [Tetrahymena thermophila SB210]|eukprot:XP_001024820.2 hypothetical protein TTHERM_00238950 [Tetrahymena thermophila SB210]